jgi:uncharacterized protein YecE (DUF72 family)
MEIRIGTSGWHYKHWRGPFYPRDMPASKMLAFYLQRFDTVEINNSFYRLPSENTFSAWRDATPAGFCFAVKGSRFITHNKKLKDPEPALERLLPNVEALDDKLGPILFQLPPQWQINVERLELFLKALPNYHRYAFEFRNATWAAKDVYDALRRHNAAWCIFHIAGFMSSCEITADFTYIRLHGPGGKYQGSYTDEQLKAWADRIHSWRGLRSAFVYFDNDQAGFAVENALRLRQLAGL